MNDKNIAIRNIINENSTLHDELDAVKAELDAEKEKHRWIPVSERLPKEAGTYMTRAEWSDCGVDVWTSPRIFNGKHWDLFNACITHWQPLPTFDENDL